MSWLKDKIFGQKPRLGSCSNLEGYESQNNSNAQYTQTQLKNFIGQGQELKTYIMGYEVVPEVRTLLFRKNTLSTRSLFLPLGRTIL